MPTTKPLAILVFTAERRLLKYSSEAYELTGYRQDEVPTLDTWCERMFPGAECSEVSELATTLLSLGSKPIEFSRRFRTAIGEDRSGHFTMVSTGHLPQTRPQLLISLVESDSDAAVLPRESSHAGTFVEERALEAMSSARENLQEALESSQRRMVARSMAIVKGQPGADDLWEELFQEAFTMDVMRKQVEAMRVSTLALQCAMRNRLTMADPDCPLTGVPLGRPVILPLGLSLERLERFWIISTLHALKGNRTKCAGRLGIALRTVRNKIRDYSIEGFKVPSPVAPTRQTTPLTR